MRMLVGTGMAFVWDRKDAGQSLGRWCGKAHHASAVPLRMGVRKKILPGIVNWKLARMQAWGLNLPACVGQTALS